MPLTDAFKRADEVLLNAVQGISDMVQMAILGPGKPGPK